MSGPVSLERTGLWHVIAGNGTGPYGFWLCFMACHIKGGTCDTVAKMELESL